MTSTTREDSEAASRPAAKSAKPREIVLSPTQYTYVLQRLLGPWISRERVLGSGEGGLTETPRLAFVEACSLIEACARKEQYVLVYATTPMLEWWITNRSRTYAQPRRIRQEWLRHFRIGASGRTKPARAVANDIATATGTKSTAPSKKRAAVPPADRTRRAEEEVYKEYPGALFGLEIEATETENLSLAAHLTVRYEEEERGRRVGGPTPRPIPFGSTADDGGDDPVEVFHLRGLAAYYRKLHRLDRLASLQRHAEEGNIRLDVARQRLLRFVTQWANQEWQRQYGDEIAAASELTEAEIERLQQWYRWSVLRWRTLAHRATVSAHVTYGSAAAAHHIEVPPHPDEQLALVRKYAQARARIAGARLWLLDKVTPSAAEEADLFDRLRAAGAAMAPFIGTMLQYLERAGLVNNGATWCAEQIEQDRLFDERFEARAERTGGPAMNVIRALHRLARPRIQSMTERDARVRIEQPSPINDAHAFVRSAMQSYCALLDRPRLGGVEAAAEMELRILCRLDILIQQALRDGFDVHVT